MSKNLADNTGKEQRGRPFEKGKSGNPSGRPQGSRNQTTLAVQELLDGEAEILARKAIDLAKAGDITALRLCLDRIAPIYKASAKPVVLDIPTSLNLTDTARYFVTAAASGELPPDIAAQLVSAIASVARVEEIESLKERLASLENAIKDKKPCK